MSLLIPPADWLARSHLADDGIESKMSVRLPLVVVVVLLLLRHVRLMGQFANDGASRMRRPLPLADASCADGHQNSRYWWTRRRARTWD